jgi:hypothetical protein
MAQIKPLYLSNGLMRQAKAGDTLLIDIGSFNSLIVNGKGVILEDGTLSDDGTQATIINLQTAYNNTNVSGDAQINLANGKDFKLINNALSQYLIFESDTGTLRISGDLEVAGTTTIVDSVVTNYDQLSITPSIPGITAFLIEPDVGVTPALPLMRVKILNSGPDVFTINADGSVSLTNVTVGGNITISGSINNIDIDSLRTTLNNHINVSANKHIASEINLNPSSFSVTGITNVQTAIQSLDTRIISNTTSINSQGVRITTLENEIVAIQSSTTTGFQHVQAVDQTIWVITHNKNNKKAIVQIYNESDELIHPNSINITENVITVTFTVAVHGVANVMFFAV